MKRVTVLRRIVNNEHMIPQREIMHTDIQLMAETRMPGAVSTLLNLMKADGTVLATGNVAKFDLGYTGADFHIVLRVMAAYGESRGITRYRREDWFITFLPESTD
jgi:hypothetical protein